MFLKDTFFREADDVLVLFCGVVNMQHLLEHLLCAPVVKRQVQYLCSHVYVRAKF